MAVAPLKLPDLAFHDTTGASRRLADPTTHASPPRCSSAERP